MVVGCYADSIVSVDTYSLAVNYASPGLVKITEMPEFVHSRNSRSPVIARGNGLIGVNKKSDNSNGVASISARNLDTVI